MTLTEAYTLRHAIPTVEDYLGLRIAAGLSPHDRAAAEAGLPNSIVSVIVEFEGQTVAMGRVVGDGGLFFQVVDIAVGVIFALGKQSTVHSSRAQHMHLFKTPMTL